MKSASTLTCVGCGASLSDSLRHPFPFRCPRADDLPDVDHLVRRELDTARIEIDREPHDNPFVRYRRFLHSYHLAREHGLSDEEYVDLVARLNDEVARVDGCGFTVTPFRTCAALDAQLGISAPGSLWIKDETRHVSGSHKARHLMGVMLYLQVLEILGLADPRARGLAVASCGNAALAAAVVARAADYPLRVFVPTTVNPHIVEQIRRLGTKVEICPRHGDQTGDPSYLQFQRAVKAGALPFCCQGSENGLTIEGGETLGWEIVDALQGSAIDRLFVQVGGGALASACIQAFTEMHAMGNPTTLPRIHAVQTCGAFPLKRAYDRLIDGATMEPPCRLSVDETMQYARAHRSQFMWPWEAEPRSLAHGILDDETYDWAAVVEGMLQSEGYPVVVNETGLEHANRIARATTGIDVDHTGSAGLAGLMQVLENDPPARHERIVVVFSGVRRQE